VHDVTTGGYPEIIITAVGDVMLGTTFPDASGGDLPPNDGADILQEVTPFLKRGDVVFGNLEGPLTEGGTSAKCAGKKLGTCYAFRVPTRVLDGRRRAWRFYVKQRVPRKQQRARRQPHRLLDVDP